MIRGSSALAWIKDSGDMGSRGLRGGNGMAGVARMKSNTGGGFSGKHRRSKKWKGPRNLNAVKRSENPKGRLFRRQVVIARGGKGFSINSKSPTESPTGKKGGAFQKENI